MLTKEYRIPLPLTVEEYRIAQLYMIAKKSREESKGADSGVEILVNEPYEDGPGGCGQYTHKIYHVGSHLPSWFKGLLPKSALTVEEKAWNAYPYTKTRFSCPFVQKFSLEIETYYCEDGGHQENIFKLTGSDMRNRIVDVIDVVKDQLHGTDYVREEDPRVYISQKTGRGPLSDNWIEEYWEECKDKKMPIANGKAIMSAYKLCKVEFHYWGMQSKIERFIQDIALRKTMLRAHRQAWAWQDEWFGLTMEDIREIERETQEALKRKMAAEKRGYDDDEDGEENENENENNENERHARESSNMDSRDSRESSVGCLEQERERERPSRGASSSSSTSSAHVLQQQNSLNSSKVQSSSSSNPNQNPNYPGPSNSSSNKLSHTSSSSTSSSNKPSAIKFSVSDMSDVVDSTETTPVFKNPPTSSRGHRSQHQHPHQHHSSRTGGGGSMGISRDAQRTKQSSAKSNLNSPGAASNKSLELLASWRMEGLMRRESESGSDDEFFDCCDGDDEGGLTKWSSLDLIPQSRPASGSGRDPLSSAPDSVDAKDSIFSQSFLQRASMRDRSKNRAFSTSTSQTRASSGDRDSDSPIMFRSSFPGGGSSTATSSTSCPTTVLCLVIHAGSCLDTNVNADFSTKKSDVTTFRGAFESVIRQHYPSMLGHVSIKLVPAPAICTDALGILSSLSPYSFDVYGTADGSKMNESVPIGAIPLLATSQHESWENAVGKMVVTANNVYHEFLKSESGRGFGGQIVFIGDSMGSVLAYDAMTKHSYSPQDTAATDEENPTSLPGLPADHLQVTGTPDRRRSSSSVSDSGNVKLDFEVSDFFMFGSPLGIILAHRKVQSDDKNVQLPRPCHQVYNLFHPTDPLATRLEPLSSSRFSAVPPMNVPRYAKYPLGDGQPYHLLECIQCNPHLFSETGFPIPNSSPATTSRRLSDVSIQSGMSSLLDALPAINLLTQKWWGNKRVDYALYCPEALQNFPPHALPHLFHASYWESTDAIAFILRQIGFQDPSSVVAQDDAEIRLFTPNQPREKWIKKRTSVKLKNVSANHRANDVIVKDGLAQIIRARFAYGPLDLVGLTGEKVDIYVMKDPPVGEWCQLATEITDKNGRITYTIPPDKSLGYGIYPIKIIVRGDHTCCDFYLGVVPSNTECVVFSIDGSFTASVSVTGRDPRVRGGAVDVVRHWQELGYLIIYVTGRPDMQHRKVVSWLAQHNFPHGFVSFADGLSTDFLQHKTDYLKSLVQDHRLVVHAAYGSSKDISMYTSVGLSPDKIFIVGKVAKKQQSQATILNEGYSSHLNALSAHGGSRAAHGNARMVIPRSYFGLPGQPMSMRRRRSAKRATSFPVMSQTGTESRGLSPRPTVKSHLSNND